MGVANNDGLHKIPVMKSVLVAIQELHGLNVLSPGTDYESRVCSHCYLDDGFDIDYAVFPCPTRVLADQALGGGDTCG